MMTDRNRFGKSVGRGWVSFAIIIILIAQVLLTGLYFYDLLSSRFALRTGPVSWQMREMLELAAAIGLLLGMALGLIAWQRTRASLSRLQSKIRVASSAFYELVKEEFDAWGLSPRESDVGLYILKGLSNAEICSVTGKAEGTIKAQTNALFRKAGVSNRSQFLGYFVEILMQEPLIEAKPIETE